MRTAHSNARHTLRLLSAALLCLCFSVRSSRIASETQQQEKHERRQRKTRAGVRGLCARACIHIGTAERVLSDEVRHSAELLVRLEHISAYLLLYSRAPTKKGPVRCGARGSCKASRVENSVPPPPLYPYFVRSLALFALTLSTVALGDGCVLAFFILFVCALTLLALPCACVCQSYLRILFVRPPALRFFFSVTSLRPCRSLSLDCSLLSARPAA